jgi:phosphonoacetate hydrolase
MMPSSRRFFLFGSAAAIAAKAPRRKVLVCLIDGLGLDYIAKSEMPGLRRLMRGGVYRLGHGMMPSLTNVNNASLATGTFPEKHGVTANTFFDPALREVVEMADRKYLRAPTIFESAHRKGWKTAFVGAKDKIRTLIGTSAHTSVSAEKEGVPMYEAANTYWVLKQGRAALRRKDVDLLYLTTSDYMMHTYAPEEEQSLEHLHLLDKHLAAIVDDHPNLELYLCADHGMNAKQAAVNPARVLSESGIGARVVAAIADKHKLHHKDLGGSLYVDVDKAEQLHEARQALANEPGIEAVLSRAEACRRFRLMPERTGDLFVLADRDTALGDIPRRRVTVKVRTHGSLHETQIPLLAYGRKLGLLQSSVDLTATRPWED